MKVLYTNFSRFFWMAVLLFFSLNGQAQTYVTSGTGSNNAFPLSSTSSNKVQWVYLPTDFAPAISAGNITHVYFKTSNAIASSTITNLTVQMGYTTQTLMVTGNWLSPMTTVYTAPTTTFTGIAAGSWFMITLQTPFFYDGVSNLVVEMSQTAYTGGITLIQNSGNGLKRLYGGVAAATGTAATGLANLGINLAPANCTATPTAGTANSAVSQVQCGDSTTLSLTGSAAGNSISYQWQRFASGSWQDFGGNATTANTPPIVNSTQFRCKVTCTSNDSFAYTPPVTVGAIPPTLNIGNDTSICPGATITLDAQNAGSTYAWSNGSNTQSITVNAAGAYSVVVTKSNGCKSYDTLNIVPGLVPQNNLAANVDQCEGTSVSLNAGNTGSTFLWSPGGQSSQSITTTTPGAYSVSVKSIDGCISNFGTTITSRPFPSVNLGNDTTICSGVQLNLDAENPGYNYLWNTGDSSQTIVTTDSGTYSVVVTSPYNCVTEDEMLISFFPSPYTEGFNFIPLFNQNLGTVQFSPLNPQNVTSYEWDFGDGSNLNTQMNPVHTYTTSGIYTVRLRVFNPCGFYEAFLPINVDLGATGVTKIDNTSMALSLYPNPSSQTITLSLNNDKVNVTQLRIVSITGAVVQERNLNTATNTLTVDISNLANGIYTLQVQTNNGSLIHKKFEVLR